MLFIFEEIFLFFQKVIIFSQKLTFLVKNCNFGSFFVLRSFFPPRIFAEGTYPRTLVLVLIEAHLTIFQIFIYIYIYIYINKYSVISHKKRNFSVISHEKRHLGTFFMSFLPQEFIDNALNIQNLTQQLHVLLKCRFLPPRIY